MPRRAGVSRLLVAALFAAACSDAAGPAPKHVGPGGPLFSFSPNGIGQSMTANGSLNESGTELAKGFDPKNPRLGDAVIATIFWLGSTNIVDSVVDFVASTPNRRVGNPFHLIEFVTANGYSMATYVATNIQNFPDSSSVSGQILAVKAYMHSPVSDGGIKISAWSGIEDNFTLAVRDAAQASGTDTGANIPAHTRPIAVNAGGIVYTATMGALDSTGGGAFTGVAPPASPFGHLRCVGGVDCPRGSDRFILEDAVYAVQANAGTVDPTWTWMYAPPARPWLVTTFSLNVATSGANQTPTANFTSSCGSPTCNFTNTSNDPDGSIAANGWTFGDGQTSNVASPSHTYAAAGTYTVTLTVTDNEGATNSVSHTVTVAAANQPPTAAFTSSCTNLTCSFTNSSSDPDGSVSANSWDFGDGQTSTAQSPSHSYGTAGTYTVTLTVTDNQSATNSVSHTVTVAAANQPPTAAFTSSCTNLTCSFTNSSSDPDGSIGANSWNFGDGQTSTAPSPSHSYATAGTYTVTLTVTDNQSATNSVSHTVTVAAANQPPTANFTFSCSALTCTFTSTSSDPDGSIASYSWNFGDGATSTSANPSHSYTTGGTYSVTLRVTDNQGAQSATTSRNVTVTPPNQPPTANFTFSCSALACNFTNSSSDPDGSISGNSWNFGDGGTSTAQNPSHSYGAGGTYTVTLTVTDNQGATNSVSSNVTVAPANQPPAAAFTSSCSGDACTFTNTSSDPDGSISASSWTFGDGSTSTAQSPSHTYTTGGTYTVMLTVTDNAGATNSVSHNVTVNRAPTAAFTSSCSNLTCTFTNSSSDPDGSIGANSWNFGDGQTSTVLSPSHSYGAAGTYTVTLTVTDNQGAANSVSHNVTVTAPNQAPTANFTFSCSALTCNFTSTSSDPDGSIASYSWNFGDGATSTAANPSHGYAAGGTYTVTLRVTDNQGAQSTTTSKNVTVTPPNQPPTANFTFSCSALTCSFTSTSSDPDGSIASYSWNFGDGATSTAQNPSHSYAAGGTYTVTLRVTDNQGAQSPTTSKSVTVTAPNSPPVVNAGSDETAVTGLLYSSTQGFTDANGNGPWTYTIDWGDGSTSSGTRTTQGNFTVGHTYVIVLPRSFTIRVTITDAAGASSSDTKVVSVLLL